MGITQQDVIYFVLTDRFYSRPSRTRWEDVDPKNPFFYHGGNLPGIMDKIPYLKHLGITALWITPVYLQTQLPEVKPYHGYWALDFNQVDPHLYVDQGKYPVGSKLYLKDLVEALHAQGIKLILDMVVNHTGYHHPGETNQPSNPTPIRSHWFNQKGLDSSQNLEKGALASLPDLDLDNHDVSDYHIQTIASWIRETGIDAIRMDTVKHVEKIFWNDYKTQIKGLFPEVSLLGEVLEYDIDRVSDYQKHWAFDSLFDFPLQDALRKVFVEGAGLDLFVSPFNQGTGILEKDGFYNNHNKLSTLLDNHDLSARFFTFCQDKFQNRDISFQVYRLALTFLFTIRGIPQLYYGTEVALEGHSDPDNRRDFPWHLFTDDYEVKPEFPQEKSVFDLTRKLIHLRKSVPALTCGDFICLYVDAFVLVYFRYVLDTAVITCLHNGWIDMPASLPIDVLGHHRIPQRLKDLLTAGSFEDPLDGQTMTLEQGKFALKLPGKSAKIWVYKKGKK